MYIAAKKRRSSMITEWARRYLERIDEPFDPWQADFFRSGCNFLARESSMGAMACWKSMNLPVDRRRETYTGPMGMLPLTRQELGRLSMFLERLAGGEDTAQELAVLRRYR